MKLGGGETVWHERMACCLLPLREKVPEGRMRDAVQSIGIEAWEDAVPLTRFHPLDADETTLSLKGRGVTTDDAAGWRLKKKRSPHERAHLFFLLSNLFSRMQCEMVE